MPTISVSHNFRCDTETAELGEDYVELARIERAERLLRLRLARAKLRCGSRLALRSVSRFADSLDDARHDASFDDAMEHAAEAAGVAMVKKMEISR